jgi:hypothetical protein
MTYVILLSMFVGFALIGIAVSSLQHDETGESRLQDQREAVSGST